MVKEKVIKEIIESLIKGNKPIGFYTREDIDKAIMERRGGDKRTRDNWFNLLWKLDYLLQPELGIYHINLSKISKLELEVKVPHQIDTRQKRLGAFF